jgi:formylglycine-generating enzyme required for sulfatase activity
VIGNRPASQEGDDHPVEMVSWFDVLEFCNRLSISEGLQTSYRVDGGRLIWDRQSSGFRLPTEAEWEYAARAGETTRFAGSDVVNEVGWFYDNARGRSHPVKQLAPNAWGLYDMSGNVWEWIWDLYGPYPDDSLSTNPAGLHRGAAHVCRGGSWYSMAEDLRVARRYHRAKGTDRAHFLGFRLARSLF